MRGAPIVQPRAFIGRTSAPRYGARADQLETPVFRQTLVVLTLAGLATPALAQETRASAAAKFQKDTNKDGVLTRVEVQARIGRMSAGQGRVDPVHAKRMADLWFTSADRNKDGKVTQPEAQALLAATFAKYDANGDGKIGGDERAAAAKGGQ
jgi:hypothetical protein